MLESTANTRIHFVAAHLCSHSSLEDIVTLSVCAYSQSTVVILNCLAVWRFRLFRVPTGALRMTDMKMEDKFNDVLAHRFACRVLNKWMNE